MAAVTDQIPGWYADPDDPALVRWHDGLSWTEHTAEATKRAPTWGRPTLDVRWFRLGTFVQAGFAAVAITDAMAIILLGVLRTVIGRYLTAPASSDVDAMRSLEGFGTLVGLMSLVAGLVTLALFIVWLYQAHRSSALQADRLRYSSPWAIAGWFAPVLNLWRPHQMVQDVHRGASRDGGDSVLVLGWWLMALLTLVTTGLALVARPEAGGDSVAHLVAVGDAAVVTILAKAVELVTAVLSVLVVQQLRGAVRQRLAPSRARTEAPDPVAPLP